MDADSLKTKYNFMKAKINKIKQEVMETRQK